MLPPRTRLVRQFILLVTTLTMIAFPAGALAARPEVNSRIDEVVDDVQFCGVHGSLHITGVQVVQGSGNTIRVTGQITQLFTADDGRTVMMHYPGRSTNMVSPNGDGTTTIVITIKGPAGIFSSHGAGGNVFMDVGITEIVLVVDDATGQVISQEASGLHGPHPIADGDATACDGFLAALG